MGYSPWGCKESDATEHTPIIYLSNGLKLKWLVKPSMSECEELGILFHGCGCVIQ